MQREQKGKLKANNPGSGVNSVAQSVWSTQHDDLLNKEYDKLATRPKFMKCMDLIQDTNNPPEDSLLGKCEQTMLTTDDFEFISVVGRGTFAKVFQVKKKSNGQIYALKVLRKDQILKMNL